jgi:serine/threonine protein kinase
MGSCSSGSRRCASFGSGVPHDAAADLSLCIMQFGSFSLPSARFYAAQILSAVEHMHSKGVIHRDLKPEKCAWICESKNKRKLTGEFLGSILLDDEMRIKVTDFGTAKLLGDKVEAVNGEGASAARPEQRKLTVVVHTELEKPRSRSFVGTPEYVSPEILSEGKESSPSCVAFPLPPSAPR